MNRMTLVENVNQKMLGEEHVRSCVQLENLIRLADT